MKNKKIIIILTSLVVLIGGIFLVNNIYQSRNKINKTKRKKQNNLAIIISDGNGTETTANEIPKGNYTLNEEKTHCENNGKVLSYDNNTGKVKFSFIGSDRCYLYFNYDDTNPPIFMEVSYKNNIFNAILYDDSKVVGYQITNDFNEPENYIKISNSKLSVNLQNNKTYYIWIKDSSNNVSYYYQNTNTEKTPLISYIVNRYNNQNAIKERTNFLESYQEKNDFLFKTTESSNNKTIYYYAGNTQNNWVKFGKSSQWFVCLNKLSNNDYYINNTGCNDGDTVISNSLMANKDYYWRIIRTDEDGGLRLLYNGISPNSQNTNIASYKFNRPDYSTSDLLIKGYIKSYTRDIVDSWYNYNLKETYEKYLNTNSVYCISANKTLEQYTSEYYNIESGTPSYRCDTSNSDILTLNSSHGIMNATETVFAGIVLDQYSNQKQYNVYFNLNKFNEQLTQQLRWILSSSAYMLFNGYYESYSFYIGGYQEYGSLRYGVQHEIYGIRPVISLGSCVNFLSGDGSPDAPYVIDPESCS